MINVEIRPQLLFPPVDAPDWLNVQHGIHSIISPSAGYFEYPQTIELRMRASGTLNAGGQ